MGVDFGGADLPELEEASAYEIVVMPAGSGTSTSRAPALWEGSYEAELLLTRATPCPVGVRAHVCPQFVLAPTVIATRRFRIAAAG